MNIENITPKYIEKRSMEIIESELGNLSHLNAEEKDVLKRVIHATADFDYCDNLKFSENALKNAKSALKDGAMIITDTNMALSGISKPALKNLGCDACCFMGDEDISKKARELNVTRAAVSMEKAARLSRERKTIFAIGNAPTALLKLFDLIKNGIIQPELIIAAPVGFVNVVHSKELIMSCNIPYIAAVGRKGGSTVAAAIVNAILYQLYKR